MKHDEASLHDASEGWRLQPSVCVRPRKAAVGPFPPCTQVKRHVKGELGIRPIYPQLEHRVEAHIVVAFLAYCLIVTLKNRLQALAPGLTPKTVLEKLGAIQMLDVWLPTTDGRWLVMPRRYTRPEAEQAILLHKLQLHLPQPAAPAHQAPTPDPNQPKRSSL